MDEFPHHLIAYKCQPQVDDKKGLIAYLKSKAMEVLVNAEYYDGITIGGVKAGKTLMKLMAQNLHTQPVPVASINLYRWQHRLDQPQSHCSSTKRSRNRGVLLSEQGWQKLVQAGVLYDRFGQRYTYEQLSERSLLDMRTVSRLLNGEVKVDKRTLKTFFRAFNLPLEAGDYISAKAGVSAGESDVSAHPTLTIQKAEFDQLIEELRQLKYHIREYDRLLHRLGLNETQVSSNAIPLQG
jgi:transcriptional regulator with XRE-family HTH domain